jgi:hypothetical protein
MARRGGPRRELAARHLRRREGVAQPLAVKSFLHHPVYFNSDAI